MPKTIPIEIKLKNNGTIDRAHHQDAIINNGDTVEWYCVKKKGGPPLGNVQFAVTNFRPDVRSGGPPFVLPLKFGKRNPGKLSIKKVTAKAAGITNTTDVLWEADWVVKIVDKKDPDRHGTLDVWDPHIIFHRG